MALTYIIIARVSSSIPNSILFSNRQNIPWYRAMIYGWYIHTRVYTRSALTTAAGPLISPIMTFIIFCLPATIIFLRYMTGSYWLQGRESLSMMGLPAILKNLFS